MDGVSHYLLPVLGPALAGTCPSNGSALLQPWDWYYDRLFQLFLSRHFQ